MSNMDSILWLMIGLFQVANAILWIYSIVVAVHLARRAGRRAWAWGLLAAGWGLSPWGRFTWRSDTSLTATGG